MQQGNIRRFGCTRKGTQRFQCRTCQHTFVETIGTVFYRRRHDQATILECLALLAERTSVAALHRTKAIKEETVLDWLREAAAHVEQISLPRPLKTLRVCVNDAPRRWQPRSPAMAVGLTDHIWTIKELLMTVVAPDHITK